MSVFANPEPESHDCEICQLPNAELRDKIDAFLCVQCNEDYNSFEF